MSLPRPIRPDHFQADLIWWDGPFKAYVEQEIQMWRISTFRSSWVHFLEGSSITKYDFSCSVCGKKSEVVFFVYE